MALQTTHAGSPRAPRAGVSEIPGKGFPAFPLILFFFYISVLYLLLIAYGKVRRSEGEEKKGTKSAVEKREALL